MRKTSLALALSLAFIRSSWCQQAPSALDSVQSLDPKLDSAAIFDGSKAQPKGGPFAAPATQPRVDLHLPKWTPEKKGQWIGALAGVGVSALLEANRKKVDPQNNALTPGGVFVISAVCLVPWGAGVGGEVANWLHHRREARRIHTLPIEGESR